MWLESRKALSKWRVHTKSIINLKQSAMKYRVSLERDEGGMFIARCPALPGCTSEGRTRKDALANIKDAIEGYIASLRKHNEPVPPSIEEKMVEVGAF
jgi:predicted RNase H-like HicB family nuclease